MWRLVGAIIGANKRAQELLDSFHRRMGYLAGICCLEIKDEPTRIIMPFDMGDGRWSLRLAFT